MVKSMNQTCQLFRGTNNYHNFTSARKYGKESLVREIRHFGVELKKNKFGRFYEFTVEGNSFLYHQIRKMIAFSMSKSLLEHDYHDLDEAFDLGTKDLDLALAPGEGLFLHDTVMNDRMVGLRNAKAKMKFKEEVIDPVIFKRKLDFGMWLKEEFDI